MAVGETAGPGSARDQRGRRPPPARGRRRIVTTTSAEGTDDTTVAKPLLGEADPELERLLAEEEEIERRTREHHETPHFRGGED